ncbi:hypothetical protein RvY_10025-2 [Ramazzottius varieornatus]|uniref:Uncharacterized protein n=1 Tax=Ramazzottius varieornatus TaxID=947166 RepID=A0A1D1VDT3_RAMVA|nr:hypothetical protein RvY_10025-2 [Ramazzottius varieornatus]
MFAEGDGSSQLIPQGGISSLLFKAPHSIHDRWSSFSFIAESQIHLSLSPPGQASFSGQTCNSQSDISGFLLLLSHTVFGIVLSA